MLSWILATPYCCLIQRELLLPEKKTQKKLWLSVGIHSTIQFDIQWFFMKIFISNFVRVPSIHSACGILNFIWYLRFLPGQLWVSFCCICSEHLRSILRDWKFPRLSQILPYWYRAKSGINVEIFSPSILRMGCGRQECSGDCVICQHHIYCLLSLDDKWLSQSISSPDGTRHNAAFTNSSPSKSFLYTLRDIFSGIGAF